MIDKQPGMYARGGLPYLNLGSRHLKVPTVKCVLLLLSSAHHSLTYEYFPSPTRASEFCLFCLYRVFLCPLELVPASFYICFRVLMFCGVHLLYDGVYNA